MKKALCIITLCLLAATCTAAYAQDDAVSPGRSVRIIGGKDAESGAWPWMAAIVDAFSASNYRGQFCGGALIHPRWIVTAAHCVQYESPHNIDVVLDVRDLKNDEGERVGVKQIIIWPAYDASADDGDIALLELESPVSYTPLPIISQDKALEGEMAVTMGWGTMNAYFSDYPEILQQVSVSIVSNATCNEAFNAYSLYYQDPVTENMLCAGFQEGGKDACFGDSGGPLIVWDENKWKLAGLVSWGESCAEPDLYGVYTRVSQFTDFISQYVPPFPVPGDLSGDNRLGLEDVIGILQTLAGIHPQSTETPLPGDFNSDGSLDLKDAMGILQLLTG